MMTFSKKESLLNFVLGGSISLGRNDYNFFNNLRNIIKKKQMITTNQVILFDNLVTKYKNQLHKHQINAEEVVSLPWDIKVVPTLPEYSQVFVTLEEDGLLTLKLPFNKKFIPAFRAIKNNNFVWDGVHKLYKTEFSLYSLRILFNILPKFFNEINYSSNLQHIIDRVIELESKIWNPTLFKTKHGFYIMACNEPLFRQVSDIELNDDPKTLLRLAQLGVKIHESIIKDDPKLKFMSEFISAVDIDDIPTVGQWLSEVGITLAVLCSYSSPKNIKLTKEIRVMLESLNTKTVLKVPDDHDSNDINGNDMVYIFQDFYKKDHTYHQNKKFSKLIKVRNSRSVSIL